MSVHHDAVRNTEGCAEDDISGFASYPIELQEFGHRAGDMSAVPFGDHSATIANGAGLVAEETCRADEHFKFGRRRGREIGSDAVFVEQRGRDHVDAFIGALRTENGGDQKLERVVVTQGAAEIGVGGAETMEDGAEPGAQFGLGSVHDQQYNIYSLRGLEPVPRERKQTRGDYHGPCSLRTVRWLQVH